ncbi:MAG TPA: TA system VapC family ribonuclease toxin [Solirubrobacterales bacterium]|nr:TA system VapC family ribonuclease toxin [Solirubrobacterales bacterium]
MLVDANLLIYATDERSPKNEAAVAWIEEQLNGSRKVGLPWQSLATFLRITTHPRILDNPLSPAVAWQQIDDWLAAPAAWVPVPGREHGRILGEIVVEHDIRANLVPDAMLAALALEHGLAVCSVDTDFARFASDGLRWHNPLA